MHTLHLCSRENLELHMTGTTSPLDIHFLLRKYNGAVIFFLTYTSSCFHLKYNLSVAGFCLRLQARTYSVRPIDRASPSLRARVPTQIWYINQAQNK
jgi:hypothetical protein